MKLFILSIVSLLLSSVVGFRLAFAEVPAQKVAVHKSFVISSNFDFGHKVYFNCSSVEQAVSDLLKTLGTQNIQVSCSGGLNQNGPSMDAIVTVQYVAWNLIMENAALSIDSAEWKQVRFHSFDNCFLYQQIFEQIQDSLTVQDVQATARCSAPGTAYRLQLTTLL